MKFISRGVPLLIGFLLLVFSVQVFSQVEEIEEPEEGEAAEEVKCHPEDLSSPYDKFQSDTVSVDSINIWYSFGQEEFKHEQYHRAIPYYWKVLVNDTVGTFKVVYSKLATCYFELAKTVEESRRAAYIDSTLLVIYRGLQKYPNYAPLHFRAGTIQRSLGRIRCAVPHYEALAKATPERKEYWEVLAKLLFQLEDERCIEIQQKVTEMDPNDLAAQNLLVEMYKFFQKDPLQIMKQMFEQDPTNVPNAMRYGKEAYVTGNYGEAVRAFQAVIQQDPKHIEAMDFLAKSYEGLNRMRDAIATYKKILRIDPKNIGALCSIASAYASLHNFSTARSYVIQAMRIDPKLGEPHMVMAEIYMEAVEYCSNQREDNNYTYDDKLVFRKAYEEYARAAKDPNYASTANSRRRQMKALLPTREEEHLHGYRKNIKDECYSWIQ